MTQALWALLRQFLYWVRTAGYYRVLWRAYDGRVTRVQEMPDDYLLNTLRFILRHRARYSATPWRWEWICAALRAEARLRGYPDDGSVPQWLHEQNLAFMARVMKER